MWILIGLFVLASIYSVIWKISENENHFILVVIFSLLLAFMCLAIPISIMSGRENLIKFESTRQTLNRARSNGSINPLEVAAIQQSVIECNQWLAVQQYYLKTQWKIYVYDKVENAKPIE